MIDEHAHERIAAIEVRLLTFETNLTQNTELTKTIAANTTELVALVKGVKVGRKFLLWVSPIIIAAVSILAYIKEHFK